MATGTYTHLDVLTIANYGMRKDVEDSFGATVVNLALTEIWKAADWRESLEELPPFWLVPSEQDHGAPLYTIPSDFWGLREAYLVDVLSADTLPQPVVPQAQLELTGSYGFPNRICYYPATNSFRVWPKVPQGVSCSRFLIRGVYKQRPPKITSTTIGSTLIPFDDVHLRSLIEVYRWALFALSGDPRGEKQYLIARQAIADMADAEGLELGDPAIAPERPLMDYASWWVL